MMRQAELDVVVLTDHKNIHYFTDYRLVSIAYKARPCVVIIAQDRLLLFTSPGEAKYLPSDSAIFSTITYNGYLAEAVDAVADQIASMPAASRKRIGIDYGQDMFGRGSLYLIDRLNRLSSGPPVVSASETLWRVRAIKTPFEAKLKKIAFDIVNRAFDHVAANAFIGITEYEFYQMLQAQVWLNGAESADPICMFFGDGDFHYGHRPADLRLREGHYVWADFNATYGGYPADRNRIARCGDPAKWELDAYKQTRSLTIEVAQGIKPGLRCCDIYNNFLRLWQTADLGPLYTHVSRIGHSGGLDITEPQSLSATDNTMIEAGMIFHIEPKLEKEGAIFQFEEVVYVRDDGVEFLSELSPEELPVIDKGPR